MGKGRRLPHFLCNFIADPFSFSNFILQLSELENFYSSC